MRDIISHSTATRCGRPPVPLVFALSRKLIGQVFGSKKRMAAIALLDVSGVSELYGALLRLAAEGAASWAAAQTT